MDTLDTTNAADNRNEHSRSTTPDSMMNRDEAKYARNCDDAVTNPESYENGLKNEDADANNEAKSDGEDFVPTKNCEGGSRNTDSKKRKRRTRYRRNNRKSPQIKSQNVSLPTEIDLNDDMLPVVTQSSHEVETDQNSNNKNQETATGSEQNNIMIGGTDAKPQDMESTIKVTTSTIVNNPNENGPLLAKQDIDLIDFAQDEPKCSIKDSESESLQVSVNENTPNDKILHEIEVAPSSVTPDVILGELGIMASKPTSSRNLYNCVHPSKGSYLHDDNINEIEVAPMTYDADLEQYHCEVKESIETSEATIATISPSMPLSSIPLVASSEPPAVGVNSVYKSPVAVADSEYVSDGEDRGPQACCTAFLRRGKLKSKNSNPALGIPEPKRRSTSLSKNFHTFFKNS